MPIIINDNNQKEKKERQREWRTNNKIFNDSENGYRAIRNIRWSGIDKVHRRKQWRKKIQKQQQQKVEKRHPIAKCCCQNIICLPICYLSVSLLLSRLCCFCLCSLVTTQISFATLNSTSLLDCFLLFV